MNATARAVSGVRQGPIRSRSFTRLGGGIADVHRRKRTPPKRMTTRTTRRTVTFTKPFALVGIDGLQPPGVHEINTDEESIDGLSFLAWRRVATTISLHWLGTTQIYRIDPVDLEAALLHDAGLTLVPTD